MKRRTFLGLLGAAPAAVALAKVPLAEVEARTVVATKYKVKEHYGVGVVNSNFANALWPGIDKWYNEQHEAHYLNYINLFDEGRQGP